jgi:hypothetical protein
VSSVPEILVDLGQPEEYAQTFLVDRQPAPPRRSGALQGLARLATGSWTALPLLFFVLSCYSVAVIMVIIVIVEIQEPQNIGFFMDQTATGRDIFFGVSNPAVAARGEDLLGRWIMPIALSIAALIHLAMSALLRRVMPR